MLSHLDQLEDLDIRYCEGVEVVVQGDILPRDALPRLRFLLLLSLPNLTGICRQLFVLKSLEEICVRQCSMLKKLPPLCSDKQGVGGMIVGPREWWEGMEWEDDHSKSVYSTIYKEEETTEIEESKEKTTEMEGGDEEALKSAGRQLERWREEKEEIAEIEEIEEVKVEIAEIEEIEEVEEEIAVVD